MVIKQPKYSAAEHARLGTELYESEVRRKVEADHQGDIVAIDIESAEFEVDKNEMAAARRLLARCPSAQIWCVRVGSPAVYRFGIRASENLP